jgi:amylosucrase
MFPPDVGAVRAALGDGAVLGLAHDEQARFWDRVAGRLPDAAAALAALYGPEAGSESLLRSLERVAAAAQLRRPALRHLDLERERHPDWFQRPDQVGYIAYAEHFGGTLDGVETRLDHLSELGITLFHLMAVLRPRAGESDGGYAVDDYRNPDPVLGTAEDLRRVADRLHERGISLCLDFVMNHTSADHEWARRACAGDARYRDFYRVYPDRTVPDRFEASLPEVFPETAPGNFTWDPDLAGWVWTTFHDYQWDLNHENPEVFVELLDAMLHLVNVGVDVLRLDAVAFTWKRLGTDSQNQPEAHLIAQAFRALLTMAAPGALLLAEAIVGPDQLVPYLGRHSYERPECHLAYNNQLMVMGWSAVAERRVSLATHALQRMVETPADTTWLTYVRCHDDIGWAVTDTDAAAVGLSGGAHRAFLARFYRGDFPGSFARGAAFGTNAQTGDERTCGMTAALCGISAARFSDPARLDDGLDRLLLLYALAFGYGGIPMIYMGDEVALGDDLGYLDDPAKAHDSRWRHRPVMDWDAVARRTDPAAVEHRAHAGLRRLVEARARCLPLHGGAHSEPIWTGTDRVFGWVRRHRRYGTLVGLANVYEQPQTISAALLDQAGLGTPVDLLGEPGGPLVVRGSLTVPPLRCRWLVESDPHPALPPPPYEP